MRRPGVDVLVAVLLPVLCVGGLALTHPDRDTGATDHAPTSAPLSTASVICPSALASPDQTGVATLAGAQVSGKVSVGLGGTTTTSPVRANRVATVDPGAGPAVVTGTGSLAPALVAGRSLPKPLAAADCTPPRGDQWFTGVGAGPTHDSVLELVNPDVGPAAADVSVWSAQKPIEVDALRGVAVPGGTSTRLDLGKIVPRQGDLTIEVHTDRGQLGASVTDVTTDLATGQSSQDWLPSQAKPARSNLLLGLAGGDGDRTLGLSNPGGSEAQATIKLVTAGSVFAPAGVQPIRVAAGTTESVSLSDLLTQAVGQGAIGLLVTSTGPVTASLRQVVGGDLSDVAPTESLSSAGALVVPAGSARLLLAGPTGVGTATVASYAANGKSLGSQDVQLRPDSGADVALPAGAALVTVEPQRTSVGAALLVTSASTTTGKGKNKTTTQGTAVVPLRTLLRTGSVPDVRPGLP